MLFPFTIVLEGSIELMIKANVSRVVRKIGTWSGLSITRFANIIKNMYIVLYVNTLYISYKHNSNYLELTEVCVHISTCFVY